MPFEITPFMPYLTRFGVEAKPVAASVNAPSDPAPSVNSQPAQSPADQSTSAPAQDQPAPAPTPQQ